MTTPERSPDRASVRYHDPRDGRPGPDGPDGGDWTERLALRNWSLPVKLTAVLLVPTLFVLTLGVLRIMEQTRDAAEFDGVQQAVALEDGTAQVMGSLADERSAAAVYVAAGRAGGSGPVEERIGATRDAVSELRRSSGLADSLDQQTRTSFDQADAELDQLDRLRDDVIDGRVDAAGAIARYTEVVDTLEIFDRSLSREAADPSVAGLASGLYSLSVVREEDAYVQAVVAAGIAAGRIDAPSIDQARNATLRRSIAVDDFRSAVGTDNAGLADAVVGPDVDNRDLLAQVVLGRGAAGLPLQVSGPDWERASSAVEDRDAATSEQLRGQLQEQAGALQQAARNGAGVASVILLLALMAGAAVVFFVTRSLLRPLRLLRRSALDVAERRLPQAVRSLREGEAPDTTIVPTPITTREEIGQVARAFDQVHEQAVRLAAEQAGLRSAFNSIFVNLSRRSQALVERQLRLIEQLENSEEDPEALSNLFQLDHLATRMRRNSENLLVLSGTDLSRRGSRPVPLVDVLRAAASEVEQYQRIDLAPPPSAQLLGRHGERRRAPRRRAARERHHVLRPRHPRAGAGDAERRRLPARRDHRLRCRHERGGPARRQRAARLAADRRRVRLAAHGPVRGRAPRHPPRHHRLAAQPRGRRRRRHGPGARVRGARRRARGRGDPGGHGRGVRGGLEVRSRPGPRWSHRAAAARPAPGWRSARVVLRARRRPRAGWRGRRPSRRRPRAPVDAAAARVVERGARHQRVQRLERPRDERHQRVGAGRKAPPVPDVRADRPARDVPGPRPPSRRASPPAALRPRSPRPPRRPPRTRPSTAPPSRTSGVVTAWSAVLPPVGPRP